MGHYGRLASTACARFNPRLSNRLTLSCRRICERWVMKVVLFCGGFGMRLRDYSDQIPKPLVDVGSRPILWHLMKYYAHYGHKDFVLCLGHGAAAIKNYFLKYDECTTNDFVYTDSGKTIELLSRDIHDWRITFVDTGLQASIGERLRQV